MAEVSRPEPLAGLMPNNLEFELPFGELELELTDIPFLSQLGTMSRSIALTTPFAAVPTNRIEVIWLSNM